MNHPDYVIADLSVPPGTLGRGRLPVAWERDGSPVELPLLVAHGARPGPTLLLTAGMHGLEVCKQLKSSQETAHIPVIMLTAKGEESDVVTGLELGADDYVPKPFRMRLLLARIRAVLRRTAGAAEGSPRVLRLHGMVMDDERHEVQVDGVPVQLTLTEYKLLRFLARHPGRVFTRTQILDNIHDEHVIVVDRAIDVHVAALRRKLGAAGNLIETIRGVGYRCKG